ncbi:MAG: hypothetical protein A2Z15_05200 [Chloroflexi bacterium RBG_16_50_11]|nr:MAG: hypothetical protein A2Z15_05200 [Chloroflexi bacterium RBG_16_50_11]
MKKLILMLAFIALMIPVTILAGCVRVDLAEKSGPITTQQYSFTDFTGIDIGHAFELVVTPSENYSIAITAGENVLKNIDVHKDGSTLVIDIDGWTDIWFFSWQSSPKVTITMPVLNELKLSGASQANVHGFKSSHDFDLELSGASELDIDMETGDFAADISGASQINGRLIAANSDMELSGASQMNLTGSGVDIRIHGSGASKVDMIGFAVNDADIEFSGASYASLTINGRMNVSLSGASKLEYAGSPTLGDIETSGASSIEQMALQ